MAYLTPPPELTSIEVACHNEGPFCEQTTYATTHLNDSTVIPGADEEMLMQYDIPAMGRDEGEASHGKRSNGEGSRSQNEI